MLSLNKIRLGYILSSLLLLVSYLLIFSTNRKLQQEKNWIINSYSLIQKVSEINMMVRSATFIAQRYFENKQNNLLEEFEEVHSNINLLHSDISRMTKDDSIQSHNEALLKAMTDRKMHALVLILEKRSGVYSSSDLSKQVYFQADDIHKQVYKMMESEIALIQKRMSTLNNFYASTDAMILVSVFMAIIAILYAVFTFNNQYQQKKKADKITNQYRMELEQNVHTLREKNIALNELKGIEKLATIGRVARVVAHEVRNPLTNIALAAEQLQDIPDFNKNDEAHSLIAIINRNSIRISQMVSDLLNATKFIQLDKQSEDINQILDESLEMAKDRLMLKKVAVIKKYSENIGRVMVDKTRIKIAFLNIIVNAIEAMEEVEGKLELTTRREDDKCVISIQDNGKGMNDHILQNLFEPYFTMKKKGNGLGLTNVQNIIVNHKGTIKVDSILGKGTTFTISLNFI